MPTNEQEPKTGTPLKIEGKQTLKKIAQNVSTFLFPNTLGGSERSDFSNEEETPVGMLYRFNVNN